MEQRAAWRRRLQPEAGCLVEEASRVRLPALPCASLSWVCLLPKRNTDGTLVRAIPCTVTFTSRYLGKKTQGNFPICLKQMASPDSNVATGILRSACCSLCPTWSGSFAAWRSTHTTPNSYTHKMYPGPPTWAGGPLKMHTL